MTVMMTFGFDSGDPLWLAGHLAVMAVVGVMIYVGYKYMNKGGKDGGIKVRV